MTQGYQSHFSTSRSVRGEKPPLDLDQHARKIFRLNLDQPAKVLTFDKWSPDPWTVVGTNGANLATFGGFVLTVIKAFTVDGKPTIFYILAMNMKADGWSPNAPEQLPTLMRVRLDFTNASGGLLESFTPSVDLQCGTDKAVELTNDFVVDVFSAITSAHLSLPQTWFWKC